MESNRKTNRAAETTGTNAYNPTKPAGSNASENAKRVQNTKNHTSTQNGRNANSCR